MDSLALLPWAFKMLTALTGYFVSPLTFVDLTAIIASTAMGAKISSSLERKSQLGTIEELIDVAHFPMILLDMLVLAALIKASLPKISTLTLSCSCINLQASLQARR